LAFFVKLIDDTSLAGDAAGDAADDAVAGKDKNAHK
jgi:hypothetical protein